MSKADVELQRDLRSAQFGRGGHLPQALERLELLLLLDQDRLLDFLRTAARPDGADGHDRPLDVGRQLDRNRRQGNHPEQNDQDHADGDLDRILNGEADQIHAQPLLAGAHDADLLPRRQTLGAFDHDRRPASATRRPRVGFGFDGVLRRHPGADRHRHGLDLDAVRLRRGQRDPNRRAVGADQDGVLG